MVNLTNKYIFVYTLLGVGPTKGCTTPPSGIAQSALIDSNHTLMQNIPEDGRADVVKIIG